MWGRETIRKFTLCALRICYKVNRVELAVEQGKISPKLRAVLSWFILAGYICADSLNLEYYHSESVEMRRTIRMDMFHRYFLFIFLFLFYFFFYLSIYLFFFFFHLSIYFFIFFCW